MPATIVRGGKDGEELSSCEALKPIHHTLVGTQNVSAAVGLKEVLDTVRAKLDDVARSVGVPDEVWLNAEVLVAICRV